MREPSSFNPKDNVADEKPPKYPSVRELFGEDENVYVMDAKVTGNIGRFLNVSTACFSPLRLSIFVCLFSALVFAECVRTERLCRQSRLAVSLGGILRSELHKGRHGADMEL